MIHGSHCIDGFAGLPACGDPDGHRSLLNHTRVTEREEVQRFTFSSPAQTQWELRNTMAYQAWLDAEQRRAVLSVTR